MLAATTTQRVLNAVPTWPLVIGVVGGAVGLAMLGNWLVRRWLPRDRPWEHNDVAGALLAVVTGLYGLVLAFVIVSVWENYRSAQEAVFSEATALAQVVTDSRCFPDTARAPITARVGDYITDVIDLRPDGATLLLAVLARDNPKELARGQVHRLLAGRLHGV
jgi:uncharacterized membrane protein YeaQ/YmgE (transglycosylase-associated protein family)